jgi:hypothetical protein
MAYNIVTTRSILNEISKSRYFRKSLGLVSTVESGGGNREFNKKDSFAYHYDSKYNTIIYATGNVGDIRFYIDPYISEPILAVYVGSDHDEFVLNFDSNIIKEKGVDFYIGHVLKEVDQMGEERVKDKMEKKVEKKPEGNADKLFNNPGSVRYEDIKDYMNKKNALRYEK